MSVDGAEMVKSIVSMQHAFKLKEVPHLSVHKGLQLYALLSTVGKLFPFWYTRKKAALKEAANAEKQQTLCSYRSIIVKEEKHMQVWEKNVWKMSWNTFHGRS